MVGKGFRNVAAIAALYALPGCSLAPLVPMTPSPEEESSCDLYATKFMGQDLIGADCDGGGIDMVLTEEEGSIVRLTNGITIKNKKAERVTEAYRDLVIGAPVKVFSAGELRMAEKKWDEYLSSKQGSGNQTQPLFLYN